VRNSLKLLLVLALSGSAAFGQSRSLSVSPTSLSFASQLIGSTSGQKTVTLTNKGKVAVSITSIVISGADSSDFGQTISCPISPKTLAAGHNCTIKVAFAPTATGTRTASLIVKDNAASSPQSVALSGSGTSAVTLSPSALNFGNQATGSASSAQQATLTNQGSTALTISQIEVQGADPADFQQSSTCAATLPAKSTCSINVTFVPTAGGTRAAVLEVIDNEGSQNLSLNGTGLAPSVKISTSTLQFGNQFVNSGSAPQSVTVTNGGNASLTITGISVTGENPSDFSESSNCPISPASLADNATCTVSVIFKPSAAGGRSAILSISDYVQGSPQVVSLFGNGANQIGIAVAPISVMLQTGVIQQFSATMSNTTNTSVTWSVNGIQAGNPSVGTIDVNGVYTAPSAVPNPSTVTITATSQADGVTASSASATIITRSLIVLHDFNVQPILQPPDGLIQARNGQLLGTTWAYGAYGSLYSMTATGQSFNLSYSFINQNTGWPPLNLTQGTNGDFYGTTWNGGENGAGAVWEYNGTSSATILHSFSSHFQPFAVAAYPWTPAMVQDNEGNLYGYGDGGIFQLASPGALNSFTLLCALGSGDGQLPSGLLVGSDGNLYGATADGGPNQDGEVFKCTQQGNLSVLYTFMGSDGTGPATLIQTTDGSLWGVTYKGGASGYGELFKIQSSDGFVNSIVFSDVYSFAASAATPDTLIVGSDGNFYGTTTLGGASDSGTIFELSSGGAFSLLHSFNGTSEGATPYGLIQGHGGTFYGVAMTTLTQWGEVFSFGLPPGGSGTPVLSLSSYSLVFGNQATGTTGVIQRLTIINIGTGNLTFTDIGLTGANKNDFALQDVTCPLSPSVLAGGSVCNMTLSFTPSASGPRNAAISISDNVAGSPQLVPLSGNGTDTSGGGSAPVANVLPASLSFGNQTVGATSGALTASVSNSGNDNLTITSISITGSNATDFADTSNCPIAPASLGVNASCSITIVFTPGAAGVRAAAVAVTDNTGSSPQFLTLTGTGQGGSLSPPPTVILEVTGATGLISSVYSGSVTLAWSSSASAGCVLSVLSPASVNGLPANVPCSTSTGFVVNLPYNESSISPQPFTLTLTASNVGGPPGTASVTVYSLPSVTFGGGTPYSSNNPVIAGSTLTCEIPLGCGVAYGISNNETAEADGLSLVLLAGVGFLGAVTGGQDGLSAVYPPISFPGYTQYLAVQPKAGIVSIQACTADVGAAASDFYYLVNDSAGNNWPSNGQAWVSQPSPCVGLPSGPFGSFVQQAWGAFQNSESVTQDAMTLFQSSQTDVNGTVSGDLVKLVLDLQPVSGGPISAGEQSFSIPTWYPVVSAASEYTVTSASGGFVVDLGLGGAGQVVMSRSVISVQGVAAPVAGAPGALPNITTVAAKGERKRQFPK